MVPNEKPWIPWVPYSFDVPISPIQTRQIHKNRACFNCWPVKSPFFNGKKLLAPGLPMSAASTINGSLGLDVIGDFIWVMGCLLGFHGEFKAGWGFRAWFPTWRSKTLGEFTKCPWNFCMHGMLPGNSLILAGWIGGTFSHSFNLELDLSGFQPGAIALKRAARYWKHSYVQPCESAHVET